METLFHLMVPVSVAMAAGFDRKKVLALAILTVLPDIDHAIVYRALMHNVFFLALVVLGLLRLTKNDRETAFLAAMFIGSHLLFDIGGGIAILYPLDDSYYSLQSQIVGKTGSLPRLYLSFSRLTKAEWTSTLYEKLSRTERVWASTEMLAAVLLAASAIAFRGVSTHNSESRRHRALGHHPPGRKKRVNIK